MNWKQWLPRKTLPRVDVRRDVVTVALWWPVLLGVGVLVFLCFAAASFWVWQEVRATPSSEGGEVDVNNGTETGFVVEAQLRKMERLARELEEALSTEGANIPPQESPREE